MKYLKKTLSVFLAVLTMLSIISTATSVFAAEYTENKVRTEYFDSTLSGYLKNIIDTDGAVKIAEKEKVSEELASKAQKKAARSAPMRKAASQQEENTDLDIDHTRLTLDLDNGENTAYLFSEPISFINKNGELVYKDTNIKSVTNEDLISHGYTYENGANDYKVYFSVDSSKGVLIVTDEGYKIKLVPNGEKSVGEKSQVEIDLINNDTFAYPNAYGSDTFLRFLPQLNGLKDEIVLDSYTGKSSFDFTLDVGTNVAVINSRGEVEIIDADKEIIQTFAVPFAYDAIGGEDATSDHYTDCTYSLAKKTDGIYTLSINVPEEYLTSVNTIYPVTIDPTTSNLSNTLDTAIYSAKSTQIQNANPTVCYGKTVSSQYGHGRAMMYFKLPEDIKNYAQISDAKYWVRETTGRTESMVTQVLLVKETWSSTTTWETRPKWYSSFSYPGKTNVTMPSRNVNSKSTDKADNPYWYAFNITNAVRAWTTGITNRGVMFRYENEDVADDYQWRSFAAKEHSTSAYRPYAVIKYTNDTTAPTISSVSGNPTSWTKSDATLTVTATDNVYGAAGIASYSFDNGSTWQTSNSKAFSSNQTVNIKVKDLAGNISAVKPVSITKIDKTAPSISKVALSPSSWTNGSVKVTVTASDAGCGLHSTAYSFDNGSTWQAANNKTYSANKTDIKVKVRDTLGNITTYASNPVKVDKIDKVKPVINSVTMTPDSWTNKEITLTVNATDDKSGVASYSFDGGKQWKTDKTQKVSSGTPITVQVKDKAGNISDKYIVTPRYDNDIPVIRKVTPNPTGWTNDKVTLIVDAVDNGNSKIASYSFDNGKTWQTGNSKAFTENQIVSIKVKDNAGNISDVTNVTITNIDKAIPNAPDIYAENGTVYISSRSFDFNEDTESPEHLEYKIGEDGTWTAYEDALTLVNTYDVTVYARVRDEAGNISDESSFVVKSTLGEYTTSCTDIAYGEGVFPVPFERTYSSTNGWFFSFEANVQPFTNGYIFTDFSGEKHYFIKNGEEKFVSADGDELELNVDNYAFKVPYGELTCYFNADGKLAFVRDNYISASYIWTASNLHIEDQAGNTSTVRIINGKPQRITIVRQDEQTLETKTKIVSYQWDGDNLVEFTDAAGNEHIYVYTNGLLTQNETETIDYSALGRVKRITQQNGAFVKFTYNDTSAKSENDTQIGKVTVADSKGVTDTWYYKDGITIASSLDNYSDEATYDPNNISNALTEDTIANAAYALKYDADESEDAAGDESGEGETSLYDKHSDGSYTFYKYDSNDRVVESLEVAKGKLTVTKDTTYAQAEAVAKSKTTTAYVGDSENISETVTLERNSENILVNAEKEVYTYYENEEMQTSKSYTWADNSWCIASEEQYNQNGKTVLVDEYDYKTEATKITRTTYEYDDKDQQTQQLVQIKNGENSFVNNLITSTSYNEQGDITVNTVSQWLNNAWYQTGCEEYAYNDYGNNTQKIETVCKNTLNAETNLVETTQTQIVTNYVYDVWNQPVRTTVKTNNETEVVTNVVYDILGRTTSVTEDEKTTAYTYDNLGNVLTVTDEEGPTTYEYSNGKLVKRTNPNGTVANYTYDSFGNLTNHSYNGYAFEYNTLGSILTAKTGEQVIASYSYSANTKQEVLDANFGNGQSVNYTYDDEGRITATKLGEETKYGYAYFDEKDADGKVTKEWSELTDYVNNLKKVFEENKTTVNDINGNFIYSVTKQRADEDDPESKDSICYNTDSYNSYSVEFCENIDHFDAVCNFDKEFVYDDENRLDSTKVLGYLSEKYDYNDRDQAIALSSSMGDVSASNYNYVYDENGNIVSERYFTKRYTNQMFEVNENTVYTYDGQGQLISSEKTSEKTLSSGEKELSARRSSYTYDSRGNITEKQVTENGTEKSYSYVYDDVWKDKLTNFDGQTITYDASGNPTNYLGHNLTWIFGRQLASFDEISYTYNENGIRTSKTVNGVTTKYYLDGAKIFFQKSNDTDGMLFYYDRNDDVVGFRYKGNTYYYVKNLQGDIIAIIMDEGFLAAEYTYDDWGNVLSVTGWQDVANANPFRYRGYYYDTDTGLYYLQSRYYDPQTGRFINCDDVNYIGITESEISYNPFAYCENEPVNHSDPSGTLSINANWFGFVLDIALTAIASWFKFSYDVIGAGLSYYARKKGIKLFYEKLMYGVVPKVRRMFSSSFTLLRKAIWRAVGNVSGNAISSFFATGLQKITVYFANLARMRKLGNMFYLASRMLTMGSLVALVLDWASDGNPYNERIYLW